MPDSRSPAEPGSAASVPGDLALLIRLLKLGSLINTPMIDGVCGPSGISQIELKVLMALSGEGQLAGHDLVGIMGMPAMNVSRAIALLRRRGWIEDFADRNNRRRRPVRLTAAGEAACEQIAPLIEDVAAALVGRLDKAERKRLAQIADKLIVAMADRIEVRHGALKLRR